MNKFEKILTTGFIIALTTWACEKSLSIDDKYNLAERITGVSLLSYVFLEGYQTYNRNLLS